MKLNSSIQLFFSVYDAFIRRNAFKVVHSYVYQVVSITDLICQVN